MSKKPYTEALVSIEDLFGDFEPVPSGIAHPLGLSSRTPVRPAYVRDHTRPEINVASGRRYYLDCGHMNHHPEAATDAAQRAGFCCADGQKKCVVASWLMVRGPYLRPFPASVRRTIEKERGLGFAGYCCDDAGWYIGGVGNDCRRNRVEGAPLCKVHRLNESPPASAEEPPTTQRPSNPRKAGRK